MSEELVAPQAKGPAKVTIAATAYDKVLRRIEAQAAGLNAALEELRGADASVRGSAVASVQAFPMFSEVDIDWEYPGAAEAPDPDVDYDPEHFAKLISELKEGMPRLIVSGGTVIPAGLTVVDEAGNPLAAYMVTPLAPVRDETGTRRHAYDYGAIRLNADSLSGAEAGEVGGSLDR
ncbi:hypothetical protein [Streptomyces sp. NPDC056194]|uniref:hypothetical protein n=1 Tax=unclassified Streptomyces TaxID=2593676 RepID=UPI0035E28081